MHLCFDMLHIIVIDNLTLVLAISSKTAFPIRSCCEEIQGSNVPQGWGPGQKKGAREGRVL